MGNGAVKADEIRTAPQYALESTQDENVVAPRHILDHLGSGPLETVGSRSKAAEPPLQQPLRCSLSGYTRIQPGTFVIDGESPRRCGGRW